MICLFTHREVLLMYTQYTSPRAGSARVRLHVVVTPRNPHLWRCRVMLEHDIGAG